MIRTRFLIAIAITSLGCTPDPGAVQPGATAPTKVPSSSPASPVGRATPETLYSPDFTVHNGPAGGTFRVTTDPGQAYRYVWNVTSQKGTAGTMTLRVENTSNGAGEAPLFLRVTQR